MITTTRTRSIFLKVEFLRDNNTWEDGYARVLFEHLFSGSPQIRAYGIFMDYAFGPGVPMSPGAHPGELVYYEKVDRITPGFTDVIHFDILEGNVKAIARPRSGIDSGERRPEIFW